MKISNETFLNILSSFPSAPPECGGIIGGQSGVISELCIDSTGSKEYAVYEPNVDYLNRTIEEWDDLESHFTGSFIAI